MSLTVDRTCTEITIGNDGLVRPGDPRSLDEFRSAAAYVLLGDPGAGKTTEFQREAELMAASGRRAEYVKARDFVALHIDSHPEWRDSVLFIDGLDEVRSGLVDSRPPLDKIRNRLDQLQPPGFRISCREADWLGRNDRQSLAVVSPDSQVTVVRLDPLNAEAIRQLLASRLPDLDVEDFVENALSSDTWQLLENPLTLQLLVDAISSGGGWPQSRRETFEMACEKLVTEHNEEHLIAVAAEPSSALLDAVGYLCALQLISDLEGYSLRRGRHDPSFWTLADLDETVSPVPNSLLSRGLATKLFTADQETGFLPRHRQLAEFLGGRYLAKLVADGLPARRATALMTASSDGRVVTALRGLSAWLAAYSEEARSLLIDADPVGVGLYGDIGGFNSGDKRRLLASLARFATEGALIGYGLRRIRDGWYGDESAWAFRSLVSVEMIPAVADLIKPNGDAGTGGRVLEFLLKVLANATDGDPESLASLSPHVEAIMRDPARPSHISQAAVEAYIRIAPPGTPKTLTLLNTLEAVHDGTHPDPDDEIAGTLLRHLYPDDLPPTEIWKYAGRRNNRSFLGRFWGFWYRVLLHKSGKNQIVELLDTLEDETRQVVQTLQDVGFEDLPVRLLAQAIQTIGDDVDLSRLCGWLTATTSPIGWDRARNRHVDSVRKWLEARSHIQKEIVLKWLSLSDSPDWFTFYRRYLGDVLHKSKLPDDFGIWCLEQAVSIATTDLYLSKKLLREAYYSLRDPTISMGLTHELIQEQTSGFAVLEGQLQELSVPVSEQNAAIDEAHWQQEMGELREQQDEKTRKRRHDWAQYLRSHETELVENRFPSHNLHYLALVYLGEQESGYTTPEDHIGDLVGGDPGLAEAVKTALLGGLWRDDVPDVDVTISLYSNEQRPWLALPVLASMGLWTQDQALARSLHTTQVCRALAIYYHWVDSRDRDAQVCHDEWFQQNPELVLDILYRCARAAIRNGAEILPGVYELDRVTGHEALINDTRLRLIEAFPTRPPNKQQRLFDGLLGNALRCAGHTRLKSLARKKLAMRSLSVAQRVRWLTVDALLTSGQRTQQFRTYVAENERRIRHLAQFLHNTSVHTARRSMLWGYGDSGLLTDLVEMLGRSFGPRELDGLVTLEIGTSELIEGLILQLSSASDTEAHEGLAGLVDDPQLGRWRERLSHALERQRIVYRDASYSHPSVPQAQSALDNRAPANPADLAALLCDRLKDLADHIRGDNTNPWRQFWNEDFHGRLTEGKPEDSCRDVLLETLKERLPRGVDAAPEGNYAANRRADIRTTFQGFNVPTEIKKNKHPDLWSALRSQLIGRYTTDPATSGYGIYLVLWFGAGETTRPPNGKRPDTPEELARQLQEELTTDELRKISVIVIDVTKPS